MQTNVCKKDIRKQLEFQINFKVKDIRGQINFSFLVAGLGFTSQSCQGFGLPPLSPTLWTGLKSSTMRLPSEAA